MKWPCYICMALLASGCSFFRDDYKPEPATIASIENKPITIEKGGTLDSTRKQAVQSYRKFLNSAQQNRYHAEAMRRIADLELEDLEERAARYSGGANEKSTRPADYEKVVKLYTSMLDKHPDYPDNDGVLYQLARVYEQSGEIEKALGVFDRMIGQYPGSKYLVEVQFRRGEILFVLRKYKKAYAAYAAVLKGGRETPFYLRALYKHGWSEFKRSRFENALTSFFRLLDIKFTDKDTGKIEEEIAYLSRGEKELMQDTFRVISLSFSYLDGARSIGEFFKSYGHRPYEYQVYRNLGNLYMKQERIRDAADTYNAFVRIQPGHRLAPDFQSEVINAYKKGGFLSLTLKAKEEFAERYNKNSRYWQVQSDKDKERIARLLRTHLEDLARYYHAQAQKQKKSALYQHAARWYRLFVDSFPKDPKTPLMNFLLAELLFESGDYLTAANEYEKTAYHYGTHPGQVEAAYASLLAMKNYEKKPGKSNRERFHTRTIEAGIRFADTFPTDKNVAGVLTSVAEDLFRRKQLDRAEKIARRVIDMQPPVKKNLRRTAWTVIAHSQFENRQYAQAEQGYIQVLRLTSRKEKKYAQVHERLIATIYKQGEQSRDNNNYREAVRHFMRLGVVSPRSKVRPMAEYDAAISLIILKDWKQAARVLENFRRRYPKHTLAKTIPGKLALVYLNSKQHGRAAAEMERIANSSKNPKIARESRWQAAELYEKADNTARAISAYINYYKKFPRPFERAMEARNHIAGIYKKTGKRKKYKNWLHNIVLNEKKGGRQRTARTRYLGASAAYILAEPKYTAFKRIRLTVPLRRSLKRKKKSMKKALKAYENIARYKVSAFTTAATYRIGEIYNQFSKDLIKSQRPRKLKKDELEQYEILLEEQAFPFEEKAIKIHDTNASRTVQGIYDKWVKKSIKVLGKLNPNQYLKQERSEASSHDIR